MVLKCCPNKRLDTPTLIKAQEKTRAARIIPLSLFTPPSPFLSSTPHTRVRVVARDQGTITKRVENTTLSSMAATQRMAQCLTNSSTSTQLQRNVPELQQRTQRNEVATGPPKRLRSQGVPTAC